MRDDNVKNVENEAVEDSNIVEGNFDMKWYDHVLVFGKNHWKKVLFAGVALLLGGVGVHVYNSRKNSEDGFVRDPEDDGVTHGYTVMDDGNGDVTYTEF